LIGGGCATPDTINLAIMDRQIFQIVVAVATLYVVAALFGGRESVTVRLMESLADAPALVWSAAYEEQTEMHACEFRINRWIAAGINSQAEIRGTNVKFGKSATVNIDQNNVASAGQITVGVIVMLYIIYGFNRLYTQQHIVVKSHSIAALRYAVIACVTLLLVAYFIVLRTDIGTLVGTSQDGLHIAAGIVAYTLLPICIFAMFVRLVAQPNQSLFGMISWVVLPFVICTLIRIGDKNTMYTCKTIIQNTPIITQPSATATAVIDMCTYVDGIYIPIDRVSIYTVDALDDPIYETACIGVTQNIVLPNRRTINDLVFLFGGCLLFVCFYATQLVDKYPIIVTATLIVYLVATLYASFFLTTSSPYIFTGDDALYWIIVICTFISLLFVRTTVKTTVYHRDPISAFFKALQ
jgi:hypothetical protein